jgi:hypothetical protein
MADMLPLDPQALNVLLDALKDVDALNARARGRRGEPLPGTPGAADLAVSPEARWILSSAGMSIAVAVDHLLAWRQVMRAGVMPTYAGPTLLRGVLESAVMTRWLLDPGADSATRVARGVSAQLDDYNERRKFEDAARRNTPGLPEPAPPGKTARARHAELVGARDASRIARVPLPSWVKLCASYGPKGNENLEWLYRMLSAFAHGKPWALHATVMGPTAPVGSIGGLRGGTVAASETMLAGATDLLATLTRVAIGEFEVYVGSR